MSESSGDAIGLQRALDCINHMNDGSLAFLDVSYDLERIHECSQTVADLGAFAIKPVLRRVLLAKPLFSRAIGYIETSMSHLAYSPAEQDALQGAKQTADERSVAIQDEITHGADPWYSHSKHSERNIRNPLTIGFYQGDDGKIQTLYGPRYFQSKRQIEDSILFSRAEIKEVNLLAGEFVQVAPKEILKGTYWDAIPQDLREKFENGEVLLTTDDDLYGMTTQDQQKFIESADPNEYTNMVNQKVLSAETEGKYLLLYYSDFGGVENGRTAVVMKVVDGELSPVRVEVSGSEYVLEVKGCGTKSGGFSGMHFRTGRDIVTGGTEAEQAQKEIERLEEDTREGVPKAVGALVFDSPKFQIFKNLSSDKKEPFEQGYIIRLTPSTVRASYMGNEVYPNIEAPEYVDRILRMYADQLAQHMFGPTPKIMDRSSHTENIMLWGNGNSTYTDYSDHVAFADNDFPHHENHGGYMTPKQMLEYYIQMVSEIPGYSAKRDRQTFYSGLQQSFGEFGVQVRFKDDDDLTSVVNNIWYSGMAYQVYTARRNDHYFPEGVWRAFNDTYRSKYTTSAFPEGTAEELVALEAKAYTDLRDVVEFYKNNPALTTPDDIDLGALAERLAVMSVTDLIQISDKIGHFVFEGNNYQVLTEAQRDSLRTRTDFYGSFQHRMVHTIQQYFEHEQDVLSSALYVCPEAERANLIAAFAEVDARSTMLTDMINDDLAGYFKLVNNPASLRRLLRFSFYVGDDAVTTAA